MTVMGPSSGAGDRAGRPVKRVLLACASVLFFMLLYTVSWSKVLPQVAGYQGGGVRRQPPPEPTDFPDEPAVFCGSNFREREEVVIHFVTPTFSRPVQMAELTRLGQTLLQVPALHWLLVEDAERCDPLLERLLQRLGLAYTHLASRMPRPLRQSRSRAPKPRGVANRRAALAWIRRHVAGAGVLYFGDDDNTYDLRLFDEIRPTRHVSVFPVALIGEYAVSAPAVLNGRVVGFYDSWPSGRRFPIDMAGFAVNLDLVRRYPNATMMYKAGYEEDSFLRELHVDADQMEARAANCTEILVWHTQTVQAKTASLLPYADPSGSSVAALLDSMSRQNLVVFTEKGKSSHFTPLAVPKTS